MNTLHRLSVTSFSIFRVTALAALMLALGALSLTAAPDPHQPDNPGGGTGDTYYVSAEKGSDANPGTEDKPWKNISKAINSLKPGDTVLIMNGTYHERMEYPYKNWKINTSGKPGEYITYRAYPGHNPKLKVDTITGFCVEGASYIEIDGLEVFGNEDPKEIVGKPINHPERLKYIDAEKNKDLNAQYTGNGISVYTHWQKKEPWSHVRIRNNKVHTVGGNGIALASGTLVLVENNEVFGVSHRSDAGNSGISCIDMKHGKVTPEKYGMVYRGNKIYDCINMIDFKGYQPLQITDGNGIILDSNNHSNYTHRTLMINNVVFNNGARALHAFRSNHVDIFNNTVYHNLRSDDVVNQEGEISGVGSKDVVVKNNIIVAQPGRLPFKLDASDLNNVQHNLMVYDRKDVPEVDDTNIIGTDPQLIRPATAEQFADFKIRTNSPAVDAGAPLDVAVVDYAGNPRMGTPDIGAYEVASATKPVVAKTDEPEKTETAPAATEEPAAAATEEAPAVAKEDKPQVSLPLIIGVVAGSIIVFVIIAVMASKPKKPRSRM